MSRYAKDTGVSVSKSQAEIHATVNRYGATGYSFAQQTTPSGEFAAVEFVIDGWRVRFTVDLPSREDYGKTETGRSRSESSALKAWEQACRQRWRALGVKAKLELVESGISEFEEEFLPHLVLPDGSTVAQHALPAARAARDSGRMPLALLPAGTGGAS